MGRNEVIEVKPEQPGALSVRLTESSIAELGEQVNLLKKFISSQLKAGKNADYWVIPGTGDKNSLLKPGAEKLAKIFQLGVRIAKVNKTIDLHAGFVNFEYTMEAYHIPTGLVVAQCEGSCNNLEKKRANVPFGDVINPCQKIAQKRGYVGVIIMATGASDFFSPDMEDEEDAENIGAKAPNRVKANIPNATGAASTDQTQSTDVCCGKQMMVSKYDESQLYCVACKAKKPRAA